MRLHQETPACWSRSPDLQACKSLKYFHYNHSKINTQWLRAAMMIRVRTHLRTLNTMTSVFFFYSAKNSGLLVCRKCDYASKIIKYETRLQLLYFTQTLPIQDAQQVSRLYPLAWDTVHIGNPQNPTQQRTQLQSLTTTQHKLWQMTKIQHSS